MNSNPKTQYLDILQIFRGIAALMIVLCHFAGSLKFYHGVSYESLDYFRAIGKYGIDFFFILSGFIITYSSHGKYNQLNSFKNYIKNRLLRIYVPYLPIGIFMLIIYHLLPGFSNSNRVISTLTSLTLFPHGNPALSVAWTLSFELCFYLLFSLSFFSKKLWNYFVLIWLAWIVIFTYSPFSYLQFLKNPVLRILFSPYNIEFILGFVLAIIVIQRIRLPVIPLFSVLFLVLVSFLYCIFTQFTLFFFSTNLLFAIVAFLIIFLATNKRNLQFKKASIMMLVGNATYSIYLIHNPLQMILIRICPKIDSVISMFIALVFVLIVTSAVGYVYYLIFEKKAIHIIKSKLIK